MMKNSVESIHTLAQTGVNYNLKSYKISGYEDETIDKISRNRYSFL